MGRAVIVGAGPAGLAAAIWALRLGWDSVIVERATVAGGQLRTYSLPVVDLPGFGPAPASALIEQLVQQVNNLGVPIYWNSPAEHWDGAVLRCQDGLAIRADWLFFAPGLRPRRLAITGEELVYPGSVSELAQGSRPQRILVVGGGDRAVEGALRLAAARHDVTLLVRSEALKARQSYQASLQRSAVRVLARTRLVKLMRDDNKIRAALATGEQVGEWIGDNVIVRIGMEPDAGPYWVRVADDRAEAALPRMTVIGDAAHQPWERSLVTAFSSAMRAVKECVLRQP